MEKKEGILLADVFSVFHDRKKVPLLYGRKGEKVVIISDRDGVMVVEKKANKDRFPVSQKVILIQ
jgi:hypothetical protein